MEAELAINFSDKFSASANYSFVDGKIYTKDFSGKDTTFHNLSKRPKNTFNVSINYQPLKELYLSVHLKTFDQFYENQFSSNPYKLKGYSVLDFYSEYAFDKKLKLFANLQNITGQKYFDVTGFNTKRFNINAGINVNF